MMRSTILFCDNRKSIVRIFDKDLTPAAATYHIVLRNLVQFLPSKKTNQKNRVPTNSLHFF
jgi:hypothetical protein